MRLRGTAIQTLALAIHELATNARKYGALAGGGGTLDVRWRVREGEDGPRVLLEWTEDGVAVDPETRAADRAGYGRELIEKALPYTLRARTSFEFRPHGIRCTIDLPLAGRGVLAPDGG